PRFAVAGAQPAAVPRHPGRGDPRARRALDHPARAPYLSQGNAQRIRGAHAATGDAAVPAPLRARGAREERLEYHRDRAPARSRSLAPLQPHPRLRATTGRQEEMTERSDTGHDQSDVPWIARLGGSDPESDDLQVVE